MKNKKIISIIIAIILVISLTTSVLIATANAKQASISITADKNEIKAGETATISVSVTTNFPVATMSIPVFYDSTLVEVKSCSTPLNYAYGAATTDKTAVDSAKIYANTDINSEKFGFVLATYIAGAGDTVAEVLTDTVVLTFTITAKADVKGNAIFKVVSESAKTDDNVKGMLYFGATPKGNVIDDIPENVKNIKLENASTIVSVSDGNNTLVLNENAPFEAIIDTVNCGDYNGTVYGFDTLGWNDAFEVDGAIADFLTTAYGDDYLEVIEADGGETTGTIINVLDENGDAVESYVYIYFGDVNGDGLVDNGDSVYMDTYGLMFEGIDDLIQMMAADISGDGMVDNADSVYSNTYGLMFEGMPTQYEIAEMVVENMYEIY